MVLLQVTDKYAASEMVMIADVQDDGHCRCGVARTGGWCVVDCRAGINFLCLSSSGRAGRPDEGGGQ